MPTTFPKVSVLMTIYNHQDFLKKSISSITKQSFKNWELIACENGSEDNSSNYLKKIKDKRIRKFFFKKNIGRTKCLNFALKKAKGEYIAILDSDDIAHPKRLDKQVKHLKKKKEIALIGSWYTLIDENDKVVKKTNYKIKDNSLSRNLLFFNLIGHSTIMFRKNLITRIGLYPENIKYMQDYAFFLRVYKKYKIEILPKNLTNCRIHHDQSETKRVSKSLLIEKELLQLLVWVKNNFKLSGIENLFYLFNYIKLKIKILKKKLI